VLGYDLLSKIPLGLWRSWVHVTYESHVTHT
jgi:hypothetical protein